MTAHEQELMYRQRAARLAKEESARKEKARLDALVGGGAKEFWDLVDTSGGIDACHPWTGHINTTWTESYDVGEFELAGFESNLAHRIACFLVFGIAPPRDHDVIPICDNRICCNVRHLAIKPHGTSPEAAVPVADFFCVAARAA